MPDNLQAQEDLIAGCFNLALLVEQHPNGRGSDGAAQGRQLWAEACRLMNALRSRGHLPPGWEKYLQHACERAAQ